MSVVPAPKKRIFRYAFCEDDVIQKVIGPRIADILRTGVSDKNDLLKKFREENNTTVSKEIFDTWMDKLPELNALFNTPVHYKLDRVLDEAIAEGDPPTFDNMTPGPPATPLGTGQRMNVTMDGNGIPRAVIGN